MELKVRLMEIHFYLEIGRNRRCLPFHRLRRRKEFGRCYADELRRQLQGVDQTRPNLVVLAYPAKLTAKRCELLSIGVAFALGVRRTATSCLRGATAPSSPARNAPSASRNTRG